MTIHNFRVIHFSTGHTGGAGLAARRLNYALLSKGLNSSFYALEQSDFKPGFGEYSIRRNVFRKIASYLTLLLQSQFSKKVLFSTISTNAISYKFIRSLGPVEETLLHFHNWANLVSERKLIKLASLGYNVILTAHDERFLGGGCHYKFDCSQNRSGCEKCPLVNDSIRLLIRFSRYNKKRLLAKAKKNFYIVAPSVWLKKEFEISDLVENTHIFHIPNTLGLTWNSDKFLYQGNSNNTIRIGIAATNSKSYVKAGDILQLLISDESLQNAGIQFIELNQVPVEKEKEDFWHKIDFLLALSRADNSPNVIHEAKSLGIPIIGSAIGGIPELLDQDFDEQIIEAKLNFYVVRNFLLKIEKRESGLLQSRSKEVFKNYTGGSIDSYYNLYKSVYNSIS